jgi:hypothetical protein
MKTKELLVHQKRLNENLKQIKKFHPPPPLERATENYFFR